MGWQLRNAGKLSWAPLAGRADASRHQGGALLSWRALWLWSEMADACRPGDDPPVCFMSRDILAQAYGVVPLSLPAHERAALIRRQQRWAQKDLAQLVTVGAVVRLNVGGHGHTARYAVLTRPKQ